MGWGGSTNRKSCVEKNTKLKNGQNGMLASTSAMPLQFVLFTTCGILLVNSLNRTGVMKMTRDSQSHLWANLVSKFPKLTRKQTVFLAVVFFVGYFTYSWMQVKPPANNGATLSGSNSTASGSAAVSIGEIGDVSGDVRISLSKENAPESTFPVKFRPIEGLAEKIEALRFDGDGEKISLRLVSERWNIDERLDIPRSMPVGRVSMTLLQTLQLTEHVDADVSKLPTPIGMRLVETWVLHLNGQPLRDYEQTLESLKAKQGDRLQFYLMFTFVTLTVQDSDQDSAEPADLPAAKRPDPIPL